MPCTSINKIENGLKKFPPYLNNKLSRDELLGKVSGSASNAVSGQLAGFLRLAVTKYVGNLEPLSRSPVAFIILLSFEVVKYLVEHCVYTLLLSISKLLTSE